MAKDIHRLQNLAQKAFVNLNRGGDDSQVKTKVTEFVAGSLLPQISARFADQGELLRAMPW